MASKDTDGGGLSLTTLVIASLSSLAAALVVHKFWQGGAILGAAITPVIVAVVSEALRKPVDAVKSRGTTVNPPPVVQSGARDDRFGIWEDQRRRRPLHVKLAVATGVVAFLIAGFFLTGAELVLGGASQNDRFRYVPGKQEKRDRGDRDPQPATTQPDEEDPAPAETTEEPPETVPPETEVQPPPETQAPAPPPAETVPPPVETTPEQPLP